MNARILAATITLAIALVTNAVTASASTAQVEAYKKMLSSVPKLEMPARAAQEVKKAKANRKQVALDVLAAAVSIAPASAPAVVRAISRVAPEIATEMVSAASVLQPELAPAIVASVPIVSAPSWAAPSVGSVNVPVNVPSRASQLAPASSGPGVGPAFPPGISTVHGYMPTHTAQIVTPVHNYSRPF